MIFRPALGLDALSVRRGAFVHRLRDGRRADERCPWIPSWSRSVHGVDAAVDELDDAVGNPASSISSNSRCATTGSCSLGEDERVPGRDRVGEKPERNHAGKLNGVIAVKTPAACESPSRRYRVPRSGGGQLASSRNATGDLDVLDTASELAVRLGECLPVFPDENLRELLLVVLEELFEFEQRLDAFLDRRLTPPRTRPVLRSRRRRRRLSS